MENSYHAIIMGGAILVFMVAVSVAIYSYTTLMDANNSILTESEYYDNTAESFEVGGVYDNRKTYSGAEIAMQIINMCEKKDFAYVSITVPSFGTFTPPTDGKPDKAINAINSILKNLSKTTTRYYVPDGNYTFSASGVSVKYSIAS